MVMADEKGRRRLTGVAVRGTLRTTQWHSWPPLPSLTTHLPTTLAIALRTYDQQLYNLHPPRCVRACGIVCRMAGWVDPLPLSYYSSDSPPVWRCKKRGGQLSWASRAPQGP